METKVFQTNAKKGGAMSLLFGEVELMETFNCRCSCFDISRVASLRRSGINGNLPALLYSLLTYLSLLFGEVELMETFKMSDI